MTVETPDEAWRAMLTGDHPDMLRIRRLFRSLPSSPHCKMCYAPFGGPGGFVLRPWFGPWPKNPQLCKMCIGNLAKQGVGGAEIELSLLFADIRGSTALGERLRPAEFSAVLNGFYRLAAKAISDHDGIVDKFVGDEAIGLFIPAYTGAGHSAKAIAAGRTLLAAVANMDPLPGVGGGDGRTTPVGARVHTGTAYVGSIGSSEEISDFTALGDVVNSTARLASLAAGGELLVSAASGAHAGLETAGLERRTVEVRGREATLDVFVLHPAA
jgi:adenylate cyclase